MSFLGVKQTVLWFCEGLASRRHDLPRGGGLAAADALHQRVDLAPLRVALLAGVCVHVGHRARVDLDDPRVLPRGIADQHVAAVRAEVAVGRGGDRIHLVLPTHPTFQCHGVLLHGGTRLRRGDRGRGGGGVGQLHEADRHSLMQEGTSWLRDSDINFLY